MFETQFIYIGNRYFIIVLNEQTMIYININSYTDVTRLHKPARVVIAKEKS